MPSDDDAGDVAGMNSISSIGVDPGPNDMVAARIGGEMCSIAAGEACEPRLRSSRFAAAERVMSWEFALAGLS